MDKKTRIKNYRSAAKKLERQMWGLTITGICAALPPIEYGRDKMDEYPELDLFVPEFLWGSERKCSHYWFGWPGLVLCQWERITCLLLCIEIAKTSEK